MEIANEERPWRILRYYLRVCLKGLREITKVLEFRFWAEIRIGDLSKKC
jgi:hypothetical protein